MYSSSHNPDDPAKLGVKGGIRPGTGGASPEPGGAVDKRAQNLQYQTAIETNRLVDVLRSLERTLGTHILALSANLRLNRVGGPPGGRDDKKGVHTRTTIINEITRHGEEDEAQALRGGDEKEAARRHTSPRGEEAAEAVAEAAAGLKKKETHLTVVFLKVGIIEPIHDRYHADVFVQARWEEPAFNGHLQLDPAEVDWKAIWSPHIRIENALEDVNHTTWHTINFNDMGTAVVHEKHRLVGHFRQYCNIKDFPFDTQELSIVAATSLTDAEISMVEDQKHEPGVMGQTSASEQEWKVVKNVMVYKKPTHDPYRENRFSHPSLKFSCVVSRRARLYVTEYAFVIFLVSAAAFSSFGVTMYAPGQRLTICILILLCLVTFQFAISHERPSVAYITHLDEYVFMHVVIICLMCLWHALSANLPYTEAGQDSKFDMLAGITFGVIFLINEIAFVSLAIVARRSNKMKITKKEKRHMGWDSAQAGSTRPGVMENFVEKEADTKPKPPTPSPPPPPPPPPAQPEPEPQPQAQPDVEEAESVHELVETGSSLPEVSP